MKGDAKAVFNQESLEIPSTSPDGNIVTEIGAFGFWKLTTLKQVTIPSTIEKINGSAFEGCTALSKIVLPDSVVYLLSSAFEGCTSLSSVVIPKSIFVIKGDVFKGCTSLTEINYTGTIEQWNALEPYRRSNWNYFR